MSLALHFMECPTVEHKDAVRGGNQSRLVRYGNDSYPARKFLKRIEDFLLSFRV